MPKKFLIVDDAPFIRDILRSFLEGEFQDTQIAEAENGFEALEKFETFKPDLIFMDIVMPKLSGIETTKQIRQTDSTTPILGLSTLDHGDIVQRLLDAGANTFIKKPFSFDEIRKNLGDFL